MEWSSPPLAEFGWWIRTLSNLVGRSYGLGIDCRHSTLLSPPLTSCSSRVQIGDLCSATSHHCDVVHMTWRYITNGPLFFFFSPSTKTVGWSLEIPPRISHDPPEARFLRKVRSNEPMYESSGRSAEQIYKILISVHEYLSTLTFTIATLTANYLKSIQLTRTLRVSLYFVSRIF